MIDGYGGSGSGGGGSISQSALAGYATQSWASETFVSIDFFNRLFSIHGNGTTVVTPNDTDTSIFSIEAKFGLWTESFVSALGLNSSGGGGGTTLNEPLASINAAGLGTPADGQTLIYSNGGWTYGTGGGSGGSGTVTSVRMTVPTGLTVTGSPITSSGTLAISLANDYSIPLTADVTKGVTAYGWGDHSQAGYATQSWVTDKGYTTNTGTVTSVRMTVPTGLSVTGSPITSSGTFALSFASGYSLPTNTKQAQWDAAYNALGNLSGTYTAWGQTFLSNGTPRSISGQLSSVTNIYMDGSVSVSGEGGLNYYIDDRYYSAILRNSTYNQLVIGYGTSQKGDVLYLEGKDVEIRLWDNNNSTFKTPLAMSLDGNRNPYVEVYKTLIISDGNGESIPITYDSTNHALCFSGDIYATGGVSALGFSSTANGGALISGALEVQSSATVSGNITAGGNLTVSGSLTAGSLNIGSGTTISKIYFEGGYLKIQSGLTTYKFQPA